MQDEQLIIKRCDAVREFFTAHETTPSKIVHVPIEIDRDVHFHYDIFLPGQEEASCTLHDEDFIPKSPVLKLGVSASLVEWLRARRSILHGPLDRFAQQESDQFDAATKARWPYVLIKALSDSYHYYVLIRDEIRPWKFESATFLNPEWVRLEGVEWSRDIFTQRGVEVRVDSIVWLVDSAS